ncbi:MAG: hypothetical protein ABH821_05980 [archaeon]
MRKQDKIKESEYITIDFFKPVQFVTQKIQINGLKLEVARVKGTKPLPSKSKSFV